MKIPIFKTLTVRTPFFSLLSTAQPQQPKAYLGNSGKESATAVLTPPPLGLFHGLCGLLHSKPTAATGIVTLNRSGMLGRLSTNLAASNGDNDNDSSDGGAVDDTDVIVTPENFDTDDELVIPATFSIGTNNNVTLMPIVQYPNNNNYLILNNSNNTVNLSLLFRLVSTQPLNDIIGVLFNVIISNSTYQVYTIFYSASLIKANNNFVITKQQLGSSKWSFNIARVQGGIGVLPIEPNGDFARAESFVTIDFAKIVTASGGDPGPFSGETTLDINIGDPILWRLNGTSEQIVAGSTSVLVKKI